MLELNEFQLTILALCLQHQRTHGDKKAWHPPVWIEEHPEFEDESIYLMQQGLIERRGLDGDASSWLWAITESGSFEVGYALGLE